MSNNSVFVSYCHEGMDTNTLEAFLSLLSGQLGSNWRVVHDRELRPGDHIDELMALLDAVDAVILLLTPSYARKVRERQGGVYEEYAVIMDRYDAQRDPESGEGEPDARSSFDLVPILFSGDEQNAVPEELRRTVYAQFTDFRVPKRSRSQSGLSPRRGEVVIPERLLRRFRGEFERITEKLATAKELRTPAFEQRFDDYLRKFFVNRKAKLNNPADVDRRQLGARFVKTKAFERLLNGNAYFVIGRKGSGKSTLAGVLASRDGRTKHRGAILVNAETLNLDLWYTTLMSDQPRSDMKHIFRNDRCFRLAWNLFQALCCIEDLALLDADAKLSEHQSMALEPIRSVYERLVPQDRREGDTKSALFVFALTKVRQYMEHCIENARPEAEHFLSDIELQFNQAAFLHYSLGTMVEALKYILTVLRRRVLFAVDGFDIMFEAFRRQAFAQGTAEESRTKAVFESEWLRALLQVVLTTKERDSSVDWLGEHLDFCVAVPTDRFLEVVATERDAFRYSERYVPLVWSGIELAILLRKRLEVLLDFFTSDDGTPGDRLRTVLEKAAKHMPSSIAFRFNGRQYELSLFAYVLRHTFWRPREVLWYFARILSAAEGLRRQKQKMGAEAVRQIVRNTTIEVINTEFIGEFSTTFTNIGVVVSVFTGARQRLTFADIFDRLRDVPFTFAIGREPLHEIEAKIAILYSLGFLGLVADRDLVEKFALRERNIFAFAEGMLPLRTARAKDGFASSEVRRDKPAWSRE